MTGPHNGTWYPVLSGLAVGDDVVASGSFLVDAETRLNPAAGSIYFGGSGGSKSGSSVTNVRPSTPDDEAAKLTAVFAKLPAEDRKLVEAQQYCPILSSNRLGSMGPPVKLTIDGHTVFLCCAGCKASAQEHPAETLAKVERLKRQPPATGGKSNEVKAAESKPAQKPVDAKDAKIAAAIAKLSEADRKLAEQQRFCAVLGESSRLGSMGVPVKVMIDGQPAFVCCAGCREDALKDPKATLSKVESLKKTNAAK